MTDLTGQLDEAPEGDRLDRLSEWVNPILIKEVRQAMRGRYFKITFCITLMLATLVGLGVLLVLIAEGGDEVVMGPPFFTAMYACLTFAALVLVPFSAFLSMGGEWDENTWDLLVLSNLRPRQIVFGKVLSGMVQSLLYFCTFGPFLVFAFLLRGIDLTAMMVALAVAFVLSFLLTCVSVAVSSLSRGRFTRVVLMVLLSAILLNVAFGFVAWGSQLMFLPAQLHDTEAQLAIAISMSIGIAVAAFFFAVTSARLAHPEENRSSGLRITALLVVLSILAWETLYDWRSPDDQRILLTTCLSFAALWVVSVFFCTEPERLGRRVAVTLPKNPLVAWLVTPLLPGGARGLLYFVFGGLLVTAWMFAYPGLADPSFSYSSGEASVPFVLLAYGVFFLGLPSGLLSRGSGMVAVRVVSRLSIFLFFILCILIPPLIGFLFNVKGLEDFDHPGNIFMVVAGLVSPSPHFAGVGEYGMGGVTLVGVGLLLVVILNAARIYRQGMEMRGAIAARSTGES